MKPSPQPDLFIAAVADAPFRDQLDLMAVPVVSLAKGRRVEPIRFKRGDTEVEVSAPPHIGIATIWDLDFVLWAVSQINEAVNRGDTPSATIHAPAYDVLRAVKRGVSGREYQRLREALDRLKATTIRTTIRAKGKRGETFSLIEHVGWAEDNQGRPKGISVTVPQWLYRAVLDRRVLALDPRRLRPAQRWDRRHAEVHDDKSANGERDIGRGGHNDRHHVQCPAHDSPASCARFDAGPA